METATATKSNLQVVQQAFNDFLKGNITGIIDICADDVEWGSYSVPGISFSGDRYGKEGVKEFFSKLAENITFTNFDPKEFITQGDWVVALGHQAGTVKSTGKSFDSNWCFTFKMKNGKLQQYFAYTDSYEQAESFKP